MRALLPVYGTAGTVRAGRLAGGGGGIRRAYGYALRGTGICSSTLVVDWTTAGSAAVCFFFFD